MLKRAQLVTFCMVVESESLTAAAERLFCVPSNVTKKLKDLEKGKWVKVEGWADAAAAKAEIIASFERAAKK
ncbi:LysR family transcriptional regulator [Serratia sp. CY81593]|uniref:LysR family transcriptional regulator n=1 Tax=Serratia sp. CY81593 TaxID=3383685 RepID=UPI003F9F97CA